MSSGPIKLYLLSGFLGAGKTTFLRRLIDHLAGRKIGVIMNEFGQIGIDGARISRHGIDILEINNGSIFCSCLKGSFIEGLIAYAKLPIDYLIVESSGMADPSTIRHILDTLVGRMSGRGYDYQGTICVVDCRHFLGQVELLPVIEKQIAAADIVVLNKTDLVEQAVLNEVESEAGRINHAARQVRTKYCDLPMEFLKPGGGLVDIKDAVEESCNTPFNRPVAKVLTTRGIFDREKLAHFLNALKSVAFRAKGYCQTEQGWLQVDVVGEQVELQPAEGEFDASRLLVIAEGLDDGTLAGEISANWARHIGVEMALALE